MVLELGKNNLPEYPFASFSDRDLSLQKGRGLEWILTNGLGGYSSSTIIGLNTRKYHGLLVSATQDLSRFVCISKFDEELRHGSSVKRLGCEEYSDGTVTEGWRQLSLVEHNHDSVAFKYNAWSADVDKKVRMIVGMNAVCVSYFVKNKMREPMEVRINVHVNLRSIYGLSKAEEGVYSPKVYSDNIFGIGSAAGYVTVLSDKAVCMLNPEQDRWIRNVLYRTDSERGDTCIEDIYCPACFSIRVPAGAAESFKVIGLGYENEELSAKAFQEILGGFGERRQVLSGGSAAWLLKLLASADSFVVNVGIKKTVIAGYHWFGEWGRDSMISLPGLTLVNGRFDYAERIFERFMNSMGPMGIPNRFDSGRPVYGDYDSTLWLVDRLYQYAKYASPEKAKTLLKPYWWNLKDVLKNYSRLVSGGLLVHESGTWMDTLQRNSAVEIQALWYNALRIMEKFALLMEDKSFDVSALCASMEDNFMDAYWNGRYLNDCIGDESLRPNQVIALSLDHCLVDREHARMILDLVSSELLTPYGLRTLNPGDERYHGTYSGDYSQREKSYHNGTVWPWLFGPYVRSWVRFNGRAGIHNIFDSLFGRHLLEAGVGTISEVFDGNPPHKPGGCISQAWSVAEPLRAYFEDIAGKKPQHQF